MQKLSCAVVALAMSFGVSHSAKASSNAAKTSSDTVVVEYGVPPIVQMKTDVMTPEKLYLLTTFLDKSYPLTVYWTKDALPLILKTEQQKQQYFGGSGTGVSSLYSGKWVQAGDLRELAGALSDFSLRRFQRRDSDSLYELDDSKEAIFTAIDVWRLPLSLKPPRYIVDGKFKRLGVFDYIFTTYPLASLDSLSKAIDGLTISNPQLAIAPKARIQNIRQIQRTYAKEYLKFFHTKGWSVTMKENAQTAAFATSYGQENQILRHELGLLKIDIARMFVELKKSQSAPAK